jgi:hypothetical protein
MELEVGSPRVGGGAGAAVLLAAVGALSASISAWRASRIDPANVFGTSEGVSASGGVSSVSVK